ncbi:hypothetical protein SCP_1005170 [Sparassis crispa]|uniref:Uncharacterized protein n=1 Tax=Sparassis crispa TaxID=139825 RepID=A0A401GYN6_9APHY|nr:hypothetical protein SCP_1005170 [Sparassis crispa]GBE87270.1 hypothetical protein SCP_1005170 [Sparassis crispa]
MSTSAQTATLVPLDVQAVETESLLFDSFLRVYDSLLNGSDQTLSTLSEKEVEAIRELYGKLSKLPLRDSLAALWCLRDARLVHDSLSYSRTRTIVECFTTPSCDSPALSLPDVYTEPREWSPDVHTNLPSPEEVFNAPVLLKQGGSIVAKVTEMLVVKYGQSISLREVAAILYVSA